MAGPADWGAVAVDEQQPQGPAAWGAQPVEQLQQQGAATGTVPVATVPQTWQASMRAAWQQGQYVSALGDLFGGMASSAVEGLIEGQARTSDLMKKEYAGTLTDAERLEMGVNFGMGLGGGDSATAEFRNTVIKPALQKIAADAAPIVPDAPAQVQPILNEPSVRDAIVNGPVERGYHVPYEAGAAEQSEKIWTAYHGTAAEQDFGADFDLSKGHLGTQNVAFFSTEPHLANDFSGSDYAGSARRMQAMADFGNLQNELRSKYGENHTEKLGKYNQGDLLEAQQIYREAAWRTQQTENNPSHEEFAAQAKSRLDEIESSIEDTKRLRSAFDAMKAAQEIPAAGPRIIPVKIKPGKSKTVDLAGRRGEPGYGIEQEVQTAINEGLDTLFIKHPEGDQIAVFNKSNISPRYTNTTFIDSGIPEVANWKGQSWETAPGLKIHEQVEDFVAKRLIAGGMDTGDAYSVSHWEYAEPAEDAYYVSQGLDPNIVEDFYKNQALRIQKAPDTDLPPDLAKYPYPHDSLSLAREGGSSVPQPSPELIGQAQKILGKSGAELAGPLQQFFEAHQLGVIGEPRPQLAPHEEESPAIQAQRDIPARAMAAGRRPDAKITMTPSGEPIDAYQQRFKEWVGKLKSPGDVDDIIARAASENDYFSQARAGEVDPAHVEKVAAAAGLDPKEIDRAGLSTKFRRDSEIRAVEQALIQARDDFRSAAANMDAEPSPENAAKMMEARVRRDYVLEYTLGLRSEWGKSGNALKDILDVAKREQAVTNLLNEKGESMDDLRDIARGMRNMTGEQVARTMTMMRGIKLQHWVFWMTTHGYLTGYITHAFYAIVNAANLVAERAVAPTVAAVLDTLRPGERQNFFGEPFAAVHGMIDGVPDAFLAMKRAAVTGVKPKLESEAQLAARGQESPQGMKTPYGPVSPDWGIWKKLADAWGIPLKARNAAELAAGGWAGRMATTEHTGFLVLGERASLRTEAYVATLKDGAAPFSDRFMTQYKSHMENPTDEALIRSVNAGYAGTFMEKLGPATQRLVSAVRGLPPLYWFFRFMHVPLNIGRAGIRWSPIAFAGPEMRAQLMGERGVRDQNLAMSRVLVGSAVMGWIGFKALKGEATGDYPTDQKERKRWQLLRIPPNSIKIGDEWYSYQRWGPARMPLSLGANLGQVLQNYNGEDDDAMAHAVGAAIIAGAKSIGDEAGMIELQNFFEATANVRSLSQYAAGEVGGLIPYSTFMGQTAAFTDPDYRRAQTLLDGIKYRIPGLRQSLPMERDPVYGEPVPNPAFESLERQQAVQNDPVKLEMARLNYFPGYPQPRIGGIHLNAQQQDEYLATAGPLAKRMLQNLVSSPGYQNMTDEAKRAHLRTTLAIARAQARQAFQVHHYDLVLQGNALRKQAILGH